ncbi:hypothetical protein CgunFtcFv8_019789 [Champsocephalus gunnari]|uniref:Uncharacterized protein n=1 Tax=Champsocephalus gunnari TaxID=52237 RepID=A0AAN8HSI2_CHAGU|nr:hypothetical protein CgunFtcFv8_019789 [Champsocephalus gunnari]
MLVLLPGCTAAEWRVIYSRMTQTSRIGTWQDPQLETLLASCRQPKRMPLPRKQDYVDIIGFEVIFHGDQIHCTPTTPTSRRLVIHCQLPDVN